MRLTLTEEREAEIRRADGLLPLVLVDESMGVDWGFPSAVAHRRALLAEVDALRAKLADVTQRFEEKLREPIPVVQVDRAAAYELVEREAREANLSIMVGPCAAIESFRPVSDQVEVLSLMGAVDVLSDRTQRVVIEDDDGEV